MGITVADENQTPVLFFGYPEEGAKFQQRHPLWPERSMNLFRAIDTAFARTQAMSEPIDKLVYMYGRMCAEDFMEILLVCGNGYGAAGMKLLRTTYEHAVTLRYLHEHPDEVGAFTDYHHVQQYKLMRSIMDTFDNQVLQPEIVADVEQRYAQVKEDFLVTDCKKCGTKRLNHTWNKLDFVAMAKRAGAIGTLIVPGYFVPLRRAHTTFGGLKDRMQIVNDRVEFQHQSQPKVADDALMTAHNCILDVLEIQAERFEVEGLREQLQICLRDFIDIWLPNAKVPNE